MTPPIPTLLTVKQFVAKHPWANEGGVRWWIYNASHNGFDKVISRIGRRVLIDEELCFEWVAERNRVQRQLRKSA